MRKTETSIAIGITSELMQYFYQNDIFDLDLKVRLTQDRLHIEITGKTDRFHDGMAEFCKQLNVPRVPGAESYHHQLLGVDGMSHIELLSSLIDEANLEQDEEHVTIWITRRIMPY